MNIHDRQAAARCGWWRRLFSSIYVTYSDLNSQPKRHGDLDLLTLKVVSESRVTWAAFVPILVFLGLSVLDLGPMYATDVRRTHVRQKHRLMPRLLGAGGIIKQVVVRFIQKSDEETNIHLSVSKLLLCCFKSIYKTNDTQQSAYPDIT